MNKPTRYIIVAIIIAVLIGLVVWYKTAPGKYDKLAQCLTTQGVTFFGAFWCPHCQEAKKEFSKSTQYLKYVECSTPDGKDQTPTCKDAHIPGYPTWEYSNIITITTTTSADSFACSSEKGKVERDCTNAAEGTWLTRVGAQEFMSPAQPTHTDTTWTFPAKSRAIGTTDPVTIGTYAQCSI